MHKLSLIAVIGCVLPLVSQAAGVIVNLDATNSAGQTLTLGAGTYSVSVVGTSTAGALYNGWDVKSDNFGTANATPTPNFWTDKFSVNVGGTTTSYDLQGGTYSASAPAALAAFQNGILYANGTSTPADASMAKNSAVFTLATSQSVNFVVTDYLFVDNWGGASLSISSVAPEPSTFGLLGLAGVGAVGFLRRKLFRQS